MNSWMEDWSVEIGADFGSVKRIGNVSKRGLSLRFSRGLRDLFSFDLIALTTAKSTNTGILPFCWGGI